jgi:hypothetical protein
MREFVDIFTANWFNLVMVAVIGIAYLIIRFINERKKK